MKPLRSFRKALTRFKPWANNILQVLDWADWKTWVWYSILGVEQVTNTILRWAKKKTRPAHVVYKRGRFYVVGDKTWPQ